MRIAVSNKDWRSAEREYAAEDRKESIKKDLPMVA